MTREISCKTLYHVTVSQLYPSGNFLPPNFPPFKGFVCVCVSAPQALLDLLFAQHTITFLLSDRVSRHTRDRARQCALETGDGARAPKPSASFTDSLILPLEIAVGGSLSLPRKLRVRYELGIILTLRKKRKRFACVLKQVETLGCWTSVLSLSGL